MHTMHYIHTSQFNIDMVAHANSGKYWKVPLVLVGNANANAMQWSEFSF